MDANEPVRLSGWTALAVGAVLQGVILAAAGTPWEGIAGAIAAQLLVSIGGLEWARNRVTPQWRADARANLHRGVQLDGEDGHANLGQVVTVLLVVLLVVLIVRLA